MRFIRNIKAQVKMIVQSFQYVLIVPEYKGAHYCWSMYGIDDWIAQYPAGTAYLIYSPYMEEPIEGLKMSGSQFLNGLRLAPAPAQNNWFVD